jgi:hypothetical protein
MSELAIMHPSRASSFTLESGVSEQSAELASRRTNG